MTSHSQNSTSQPKVPKRVEQIREYSAEDKPIVETLNKWRSELMNSAKYGDILGMGTGLQTENGQIKVPYVKGIVIYVRHANELTANIPAVLDGIPVDVVDTGGGIIAAGTN